MKKFFGILLAVVTTLVLLPCCGGGGDDEGAGVMGVYDFVNGNTILKMGGLNGQSTLYMTGLNTGTGTKVEGDTATNVRFKAGVGGRGEMTESGTTNYTVIRDADSDKIISGSLLMSFDDTADNEDVVQFFGFAGNPDDDEGGNAGGGNAGGGAGEGEGDGGGEDAMVLEVTLDFVNSIWTDNQGHTGALWVEFR